MRTDVKLGVISSAVIVFVTGGYYVFRDRGAQTIPVTEPALTTATPSPASAPADKSGRAATADPANNGRRGAQPARPRPQQRPGTATPRETPRPGVVTTGASTPGESVATNAKPEPSVPNRPQPSSPGEAAGLASRPNEGGSRPPSMQPRPEAAPSTAPPNVNPTGSTPLVTGANPASSTPGGTLPGAPSTQPTIPATTGGPAAPPNDPATRSANATSPTTDSAKTGSPASPWKVTDTKTPANLPGENVDAAVEVHRVQPGDTFALLARRYYGQERLADFLAQSNPQIANSRPLAIGEMVRIPPAPTGDSVPASAPGSSKLAGAAKPAHGVPLTAQSPAPNAPAKGATPEKANAAPTKAARTHRVRNGDTFYAIARDVLGDAGRWKELYELNRSRVGGDPDRLKVGQEIVLPEK